MPNWCQNYITITGKDAGKIYNIIQSIPDDQGIMETLCTTDTPEYKELCEEVAFFHPFSTYFGTKWDFGKRDVDDISFVTGYGTGAVSISIPESEIPHETITISVDTAWSPPLAFLEKLTKTYDVTAEIEYFEPGMDFGGMSEFDNGEIIDEFYGNYHYALYRIDNEHFWELMTDEWFLEQHKYKADSIVKTLSFMTPEDVEKLEKLINEIKEQTNDWN